MGFPLSNRLYSLQSTCKYIIIFLWIHLSHILHSPTEIMNNEIFGQACQLLLEQHSQWAPSSILTEPKPQKRNIYSDRGACDMIHVRYWAPSGTSLSVWIRTQSLEKIQPLFCLRKGWGLIFFATWLQVSVNSGEISFQGCEGFLSLHCTSISSWQFLLWSRDLPRED